MDDTAEGLLNTARFVRRRLRAELIATEASAPRDSHGTIQGEDAKSITRLHAKIEYINSMVVRHELEFDALATWSKQSVRSVTATGTPAVAI